MRVIPLKEWTPATQNRTYRIVTKEDKRETWYLTRNQTSNESLPNLLNTFLFRSPCSPKRAAHASAVHKKHSSRKGGTLQLYHQ